MHSNVKYYSTKKNVKYYYLTFKIHLNVTRETPLNC